MDRYKQRLREWYDGIAKRYDTWGDREGEHAVVDVSHEVCQFQTILNSVHIGARDKILDVAVGTGIYLLEAIRRGGVGYGIDISRNMLAVLTEKIFLGRAKGKIGGLCLADAASMPFRERVFDLILCIGLFDYYDFEHITTFLDECKRVGRQKCKYVVDFPNREKKETRIFQEKERSVGHEVYLHTRGEIELFLFSQGFKVVVRRVAGIEVQYLLVRR